jgi:beta-lactamase regulating signal transducer with metallopeptidase domain
MYETITGALEALARGATPFLLGATLKSSALLLAAGTVTLMLRRGSAAQRHLVWSLAVVGALVIPLLSRVVPSVEVPVPTVAVPATPTTTPAPVSPVPPVDAATTVPEVIDAPPAPAAALPTAVSDVGLAPAVGEIAIDSASATLWGVVAMILVALWFSGLVALLSYLVAGMLRLRHLTRTATPITSGRVWRTAERVCLRLELFVQPAVLRGDDDAIPMTWGLFHPVVLLPTGVEEWTDARVEAVLVHELGHVKRRDYLAQVCAQIACAVYWFNPLIWMAAHRMRVEREHACDDLVVSTGHEAAGYAEDLLRIATAFRSTGRTQAAALGMARTAHLRERLTAILDDTRRRGGLTRRRIIEAAGATILISALLATLTPANAAPAPTTGDPRLAIDAPGVSMTLPPIARAAATRAQEAGAMCGPADGEAHSRSSITNNDRRTIEVEYGDCTSTVRIDGDVEFTENFSAIARLASNAFMRFDVERGRSTRRLEVRPGSGGRPEYKWTMDGRDQTFDAAAERWLASALLDLFRSSSYMARERATWIMRERGPDGIFAEVGLMLADHAQSTYLSILLEQGNLSSSDVRRVIEVAGREIESDHALGQVLLATAESYTFDAVSRAAFLQAATSLESDHTQGMVFEAALTRGDLTPENLEALLTSAASSIESDHTLGGVLIHVGERYGLQPRLREPYLRAAATIESDHTLGMVYTALLEQPDVSSEEIAAVLEASAGIESDHTLSELLIQTARRGVRGGGLQRAYLEAAAHIESDHSLGQTLMAFSDMDGVAEQEQLALLRATRNLDSDHQLAEVLVHFADGRRVEGAVRDAYLEALDGIGSRHARERAAEAISRQE